MERMRILIGGSSGFLGTALVARLRDAGHGVVRLVRREAATDPAEKAGIRVAHLRTGLVVGPGGGLLKPILPLFRLGLGGRLGSGGQWMPWISLADWVAAVEWLLTADVTGAVNLTGPAP